MEMNLKSLENAVEWEKAGVRLPRFNIAEMREKTVRNPVWIHFGAGNIFRSFIAALSQSLLNSGDATEGIIAADTFDEEIITDIFGENDNLSMNVTLNPDATTDREIIASIAEALFFGPENIERIREIFASPSLQLVSFTITEKGYALRGTDGMFLPRVAEDLEKGLSSPRHAMTVLTSLLHHRYLNGEYPLAVVSMDNCSRNGDRLKAGVTETAREWLSRGFVSSDFADWLNDDKRVSFPLTMIDKITPRPAPSIQKLLEESGIEGMNPKKTASGSFVAPFVNAEKPQYLVVEDKFPNGRPALEKAGVCFTDREKVNMAEKMKVTACLNPLHTALAVYGCLLGYTLIADEMKDSELLKLVKRLGYDEGLPVVPDPEILNPLAFLDEVVTVRLPNPFIPDTPQRIATDTSQKMAVRFGETIKSYISENRPLESLIALPLAIAGWLRYLLGTDDNGEPFTLSGDPLLSELQNLLRGVETGKPESADGKLDAILQNSAVFGLDLTKTALYPRIYDYFREEIAGTGAVRATLRKHLK